MSVVGRAYVNVRAVTSAVEGDIRRGVDDALDKVSRQVGSGEGSAGDRVGQNLGDSIGEGVRRSRASERIERTVTDDVDTDRAGSALGDALATSIFDGLAFRTKVKSGLSRAIDLALPDVNADGAKRGEDFGDQLTAGISKSLGAAASVVGAGFSALLPVAIPPGLTQGLGLISSLSAAAVAGVSTLGPALATLGVTGAAGLGALLTTVGALTLAFKTQSGELANLKESLQPVADDFRETGIAIQRDLFPVLSNVATRINAALGDDVRRGLLQTSDVVGSIANRFAKLAEQPFFQANVASILESNAVAMNRFGGAGINVAGILSDVAAAAGPSIERVSKAVRDLTDDLFDDTRLSAQNGGLVSFFDRAVDTTFQWGRILGDVGSALGDILDIGSNLGGSLLDKLEGVTTGFRDWADSATGQGSIQEWFEQAGPVISAVGRVIGSLGSTLADITSDTTEVTKTLDGLAEGLPGVGGVIRELSTSFSTLLGTILPIVGELGDRLAPYIGDAADGLSGALQPALENIVDPVGDLAQNILKLADNIAPLITVVGTGLGPVLDLASTAINGINLALDALPGPVATVVLSLAALRFAFSRAVASEVLGPKIAAYQAQMAAVRAANIETGASFAAVRAGASTTIGILGGPIGIALGAAALAFGIFAGKQDKAKESADALTGAYDEQTGAITELGRTTLNKTLQDDGLLDAADKLGISYSTVTDAVLGNVDAQRQLKEQLETIGFDTTQTSLEDLKRGFSDAEIATIDLQRNSANLYAELFGGYSAIDGSSEKVQGLIPQYQGAADSAAQLAEANSGVAASADQAAPSLGRMAKQNNEITGSSQSATSTLKEMRRTIIAVNEAAVKGIEGQIGFRQAISDAKKEFKDSKDTLSLYTQAGRDNTSTLLDIANAANGVTGSTEKQQKALKEARDTILQLAEAKTGDEDKAKKLANKIFDLSEQYTKIPKNVKTNVEAPTLKEQTAQAKALREILENIGGNTYTFAVKQGNVPTGPVQGPGLNGDGPTAAAPTSGGTRPNAVPRAAVPAPGSGVTFNGPVTIQPHNYKDFTNNLQKRDRRRALGGVGE